ncbi:MAG TPA: 3,4-dihydroxy-2-butanone-4-phosphate synthase, partial [Acidimicrobiales bacterium]|nr:3,4-dihydroxy-2-butanone-4-phosphate synthase [Acidimicrobiales bacterium]
MNVASIVPADQILGPAVGDLGEGNLVVLRDPQGSVPTYHLVAAAQIVSADAIATMLREAVGMPLLALPAVRCDALDLTPMGNQPTGREMMITFEARSGVSTGISAADRALTMRVAAAPQSTAADIV